MAAKRSKICLLLDFFLFCVWVLAKATNFSVLIYVQLDVFAIGVFDSHDF